MLNNRRFLKIFSLVAAVLLWMYVMVEVDPQKTAKVSDVTISFTNEDMLAERGLAAIVPDDTYLSVRIQGNRSDVNDVKKHGMMAHVDVSTCDEGKNSREIEIYAPDGIRIESVSEEYLTFRVEEIVTKEKPLTLSFDEDTAGEKCELGKVPWIISAEYDEVTVSGAKSIVSRVAGVEGIVSDDDISEERSSWVNADVKAVDKNGREVSGVTIQNGENIGAEIRLLTVKNVSLSVSAVNVPDGFEAKELGIGAKVKIVGEPDVIDGIEELTGTVDLEGIEDTETHRIEADVELPYGVYLYNREKSPTVRVSLTKAE